MTSRPFFLQHLTTVALVLVAAVAAAPAPGDNILRPVAPACSTSGNYTDGSQYQKNLAELLAGMPAAAAANGWFYNGTAGTGADQVYGLIMCYADRNATQCQDCLARAPAGVASSVCPGSRSVSAAYDACVLRYSDAPLPPDPGVAFYVFEDTGAEVDDPFSLDAARSDLMVALAAAAAESPVLLANGSAPCAGAEEEVFGMAQCTRDLTAGQCASCLAGYVDKLAEVFGDYTGGATKGYSCYVRYRIGAFDVTLPPSPAALPPSASPPPSPSQSPPPSASPPPSPSQSPPPSASPPPSPSQSPPPSASPPPSPSQSPPPSASPPPSPSSPPPSASPPPSVAPPPSPSQSPPPTASPPPSPSQSPPPSVSPPPSPSQSPPPSASPPQSPPPSVSPPTSPPQSPPPSASPPPSPSQSPPPSASSPPSPSQAPLPLPSPSVAPACP